MNDERVARVLAETLLWACIPCGRMAVVIHTGLPKKGSASFAVTDMFGARYRVTVEPDLSRERWSIRGLPTSVYLRLRRTLAIRERGTA